MTEAEVYQTIGSLVEGKVYPYVAPQGTTPPYVVFSIPSVVWEDVLCGQSASASSIQVDVYANTIDEARAAREMVRGGFMVFNPVQMMDLQDYEPDTGLFRATLEIQIW